MDEEGEKHRRRGVGGGKEWSGEEEGIGGHTKEGEGGDRRYGHFGPQGSAPSIDQFCNLQDREPPAPGGFPRGLHYCVGVAKLEASTYISDSVLYSESVWRLMEQG